MLEYIKTLNFVFEITSIKTNEGNAEVVTEGFVKIEASSKQDAIKQIKSMLDTEYKVLRRVMFSRYQKGEDIAMPERKFAELIGILSELKDKPTSRYLYKG